MKHRLTDLIARAQALQDAYAARRKAHTDAERERLTEQRKARILATGASDPDMAAMFGGPEDRQR